MMVVSFGVVLNDVSMDIIGLTFHRRGLRHGGRHHASSASIFLVYLDFDGQNEPRTPDGWNSSRLRF